MQGWTNQAVHFQTATRYQGDRVLLWLSLLFNLLLLFLYLTRYSKEWYARMVADPANRAHYTVPGSTLSSADERKILRMDKRRK